MDPSPQRETRGEEGGGGRGLAGRAGKREKTCPQEWGHGSPKAAPRLGAMLSPGRHDATIGVMGKFKPVRANAKKTTRPQGAAGCVILVLAIMVGVMVFLYLVMKSNANG